MLISCGDVERGLEKVGDPCVCLRHTYPRLEVQEPTSEAIRLFERAAKSKSPVKSKLLQAFDALPAGMRAGVLRRVFRSGLESLGSNPGGRLLDLQQVRLALYAAHLSEELAVSCCPQLEALLRTAPVKLQLEIASCLLFLYRGPECSEHAERLWATFTRALKSPRSGVRAAALEEFEYLGSMATREAVHAIVAVIAEGGANSSEIVTAGVMLGAVAEAQPVVYAALAPHASDDLLLWGFLRGVALGRVELTREQVQRLQDWSMGRRREIRRAFLSALSRQSPSEEKRDALEVLLADESSEIRAAAELVRSAWSHGAGDFDPFSDDRPPK